MKHYTNIILKPLTQKPPPCHEGTNHENILLLPLSDQSHLNDYIYFVCTGTSCCNITSHHHHTPSKGSLRLEKSPLFHHGLRGRVVTSPLFHHGLRGRVVTTSLFHHGLRGRVVTSYPLTCIHPRVMTSYLSCTSNTSSSLFISQESDDPFCFGIIMCVIFNSFLD